MNAYNLIKFAENSGHIALIGLFLLLGIGLLG